MFISLIRILTFPGAKTHLCCNVGLHDRLRFTRGVYLSSVEHFPVVILETIIMFTASRERQTLTSIAPQPQQQQQWQIGHFHCYSLHISRLKLTQTTSSTSAMSLFALTNTCLAGRRLFMLSKHHCHVGRGHPTSLRYAASFCLVTPQSIHTRLIHIHATSTPRPVSMQIGLRRYTFCTFCRSRKAIDGLISLHSEADNCPHSVISG